MNAEPIPVEVKRGGGTIVIAQGPVKKQPYYFMVHLTEGQAREVAADLTALLDARPVPLDYVRHLADSHDGDDAAEMTALGAASPEAVHADLHDARDCAHDHDWDYEPLIEEGDDAPPAPPVTYRPAVNAFYCVTHEGTGDADDLECDCADPADGPCDFRPCYVEATP